MNLSNNRVKLSGMVSSPVIFNHKVKNEEFFGFIIKVNRLSENSDYIKIIANQNIIKDMELKPGCLIEVEGQFRSYNNNYNASDNKLILVVFAKSIAPIFENFMPCNEIILNGYICKNPTYRRTPFGREITDVLVAVNRNNNKSDYIPCIAWGKNASYVGGLNIGTNLEIVGRIQSRLYEKKDELNNMVTKTAYEVSITDTAISAEIV